MRRLSCTQYYFTSSHADVNDWRSSSISNGRVSTVTNFEFSVPSNANLALVHASTSVLSVHGDQTPDDRVDFVEGPRNVSTLVGKRVNNFRDLFYR